jgi:uncharacterized delta-60 repeat protein
MTHRSGRRRAASAIFSILALSAALQTPVLGVSPSSAHQPALALEAETGILDPTWSGDGILQHLSTYAAPMAPAPSGHLFVASYGESVSTKQFSVAKYEPSGDPSPGFGTNGTLKRDFGSGGYRNYPALIDLTDSGVLVVGERYTNAEFGLTARLGVARLRADGTYDPSFSGDGRATYKVFNAEHDMVSAFRVQVLSGGKIGLAVAAFDYDAHDELVLTGQAILRLNANGTADTTFSGDARIPLSNDYSDVAFLPNGALFVGRQAGVVHEVRKLLPNGARDNTFSGDGVVAVNCSTHLGANLSFDPSGRPVLMCVRSTAPGLNLGIFRFTTTGAVDTTYSGDGKTALVVPWGPTGRMWTVDFDEAARPWAAVRSHTDTKSVLVHTLDDAGAPNAAFSEDGKATATLPWKVELWDMEPSAGRLYLQDDDVNDGYVHISALVA